MKILDSAGRTIEYFTLDLVSEEESAIIIIKVQIDEESFLKSSVSDFVTAWGRETGSGDSFTNLTTGIDLSGYTPGEYISFDIKLIAGDFDGAHRTILGIGPIKSTMIGWGA